MNNTLDNLLTKVYDLEGLLLVMKRHHDDIPQLVIEKFKETAAEIHEVSQWLDLKSMEMSMAPGTHNVAPQPVSAAPVHEVPKVPEIPDVPEVPEAPEVSQQTMPEPPPFTSDLTVKKVDITEAFSINDRFLFQRELFDGNKQKFDEAIAEMQRLADIDKIQEFMTDELGWNTADEIVQEFVRLVNISLKK